ncbi:DgyrCDS678 [Dimorphilus gyrociliatus]|uniref:DgyrCDS678 n=1 Tax=Dimorphilus gyrociliatus TaxID=2664684 RepID=A0A7I8V9X4_9ANNE|nr:DgyrCDS678 [Dimorphilus gyrociliatus]
MSSNEVKKDESKFDRLKKLFKGNSKTSSPSNLPHVPLQTSPQNPFQLTQACVNSIGCGHPESYRIKNIKDLTEIIQTKMIKKEHIVTLWNCVRDLKTSDNSIARQTCFRFFYSLIQGQHERLETMKSVIFDDLNSVKYVEDFDYKILCFQSLTQNGKNLSKIEEETGPAVAAWEKELVNDYEKLKGKIVIEFLRLIVNIIKYNAAHLDEENLSELVRETCNLAQVTDNLEEMKSCLALLMCIVSYSYLPTDCLYAVVVCLCKVLNVHTDCVSSVWKLMRAIFQDHLGHAALLVTCRILEDKENAKDTILLRGAVYFVGAALWGRERVETIKCPASVVLPCMIQALVNSDHPLVAYEIARSVRRLIEKYGTDCEMMTWSGVLDVIQTLLDFTNSNVFAASSALSPHILTEFHRIISDVEDAYEKESNFSSLADRFFDIVEECANDRPEKSLLLLIQHRVLLVHPNLPGWTIQLKELVDKYFR